MAYPDPISLYVWLLVSLPDTNIFLVFELIESNNLIVWIVVK